MKLHQILQDQTIAATQFDFTGTCPDKEGSPYTATIFNTAYFISQILHNYFNRDIFILDPDNAYTEFCNIFNLWEANRGMMFARMAYAYSLGYNPIENYSSIESHTGSDTFQNGKTTTHNWTNDTLTHTWNQDALTHNWTNDKLQRDYTNLATTTSHTNDKVKTTYNQVKDDTESYKFGVNSSTKVQESENVNTRTGNDEVEYSGTKSDTTSGSYSDTHSGSYSDTHTGSYSDAHTGSYSDANSGNDVTQYNSTVTKSGNIGVMTASQMLQSEYDGLNQDLANRAIMDFLQQHTFYSGEVDF